MAGKTAGGSCVDGSTWHAPLSVTNQGKKLSRAGTVGWKKGRYNTHKHQKHSQTTKDLLQIKLGMFAKG